MNITLSNKKNTEVFIIPVVPPDISLKQPTKNETFETIKGDINLIGNKGLREISWESFFPTKKYSFVKTGSDENGWNYVDFINNSIERKLPIRIAVTTNDKHTICNMLVSVETWEYRLDEAGDIVYSIGFKEFKENA